MSFEPKFSLTREENLFLVHKYIVEFIWNSAQLEGLNVTFYDGFASNVPVNDVIVINNFLHECAKMRRQKRKLMRPHFTLPSRDQK